MEARSCLEGSRRAVSWLFLGGVTQLGGMSSLGIEGLRWRGILVKWMA